MSYEEKSSWILGVVAVVAFAVYLVITLGQATTQPLIDTPYVATMLWTIGGAIAVSIVLSIVVGLFSRSRKRDQRDREFSRFGETVGHGFLVAGALAALIMAWLEWDWFWIANVIYLAFVLSGIVSSIARIVAYRRGIVGAW
jgi:MFS family permease